MLMQKNVFILKVSIKKPIRSSYAKRVNEMAGIRCPKFYFLNGLESSMFLRKKNLNIFLEHRWSQTSFDLPTQMTETQEHFGYASSAC